ncbi:MAG: hypothetical protein ACPGOV_12125 [Magnetovibrionaceae bacterium]
MVARVIEKAAAVGHCFQHDPLPEAEWQKVVEGDRDVPSDFQSLHALVSVLYPPLGPEPTPDNIEKLPVGLQDVVGDPQGYSGTYLADRIHQGLRNPTLTETQLDEIGRLISGAVPRFDAEVVTSHFDIKFLQPQAGAPDSNQRISTQLVQEVGSFLEDAYARYKDTFGKKPYRGNAAIHKRIAVQIYDFPDYYGFTTVNGPIALHASTMREYKQSRRAVPAHELFHRIQFAFGYRVDWAPTDASSFQWWTEGSAAWAALWVTGDVAGDPSFISYMWDNPDGSYKRLHYTALPLWVFLESQGKSGDSSFLGPVEFFSRISDENTEKIIPDIVKDDFNGPDGSQMEWFLHLFYANAVGGENWRNHSTSIYHDEGHPLYTVLVDIFDRVITPAALPEHSEITISPDSIDNMDSQDVAAGETKIFVVDFARGAEGQTAKVLITTEHPADQVFVSFLRLLDGVATEIQVTGNHPTHSAACTHRLTAEPSIGQNPPNEKIVVVVSCARFSRALSRTTAKLTCNLM